MAIEPLRKSAPIAVTPANVDAEEGILGTLLVFPEMTGRVLDGLISDDFTDERQLIFEAMKSSLDRGRLPDTFQVTKELERTRDLETVGDYTLHDLQCNLTSLRPIEENVAAVKEASQLRLLYQLGVKLAQSALRRDPDALEMAEKEILSIATRSGSTTTRSLSDVMTQFLTTMDTRRDNFEHGIANGIPTGLHALDRLIGAFQPGEMIVLCARPSVGKSAFALNIALNMVRQLATRDERQRRRHVVIFSLEMTAQALGQRLIAMETPMDQSFLQTGAIDDDQYGEVVTRATELATLNLEIDDKTRTIADIKSKARSIHARCPLDALMIDYLQLIRSVGRDKNTLRAEEVAQISGELKALSMELNIPVLVLAQFNREGEKRADKIPQLSDLKESGAIEQDADIVIALKVSDAALILKKQNSEYPLDVVVLKDRNGRIGDVQVTFKPRSTKIVDYDVIAAPMGAYEDNDDGE